MKGYSLKDKFMAAVKTPHLLLTTKGYVDAWREDESINPVIADEPLTEKETALVKSIFGNEIDTDCVRKYFSRGDGESNAATFGSRIKFYDLKNWEEDYSQSENPSTFGTFIHEMTHVWQHQHKIRDAYRSLLDQNLGRVYELSPQSRFRDFGQEQQAYIIQDYALQSLFPGRSNASLNVNGGKTALNLQLLQKVVEDRFPQARITREALERQRNTPPKHTLKLG